MAINLDNITINRIGWKDDPDTSTPLDSGNLKEMENNAESGINELKTNVQTAFTDLLKLVFPIGSTYITQDNTDPKLILGFGTWERLKGRVCLGLDEDDTDLNTIGNVGGEKKHTLTVQEMPQHKHNFQESGRVVYWDAGLTPLGGLTTGSNVQVTYSSYTKNSGGNQSHNNMQPYEVVGYMWIRKS